MEDHEWQGKIAHFIDRPDEDGSTFTFVLSPLTTVTIYNAREGMVTDTELYWPTGKGTRSQPGDIAYLYNPQGILMRSFSE